MSDVDELLGEVSECKISLKALGTECNSRKQLQKIQAAFMKVTNCSDWVTATEKYPSFTTAEKLEPFKRLNFSTTTVPEQFMQFCQQAMAYKPSEDATRLHTVDNDDLFLIAIKSCVGVFWKQDVLQISTECLNQAFTQLSLKSKFPGFKLAIFDLPTGNSNENFNSKVRNFLNGLKTFLTS